MKKRATRGIVKKERRTKLIGCKVTPSEKDEVILLAGRAGMDLSEFVRARIFHDGKKS